MRTVATVVAYAAFGYALVVAAVFLMQEHLLYFPGMDRNNPATPVQLRLPYEALKLPTADGETLAAWYVPAPEARGTALFFHGNAGSIAHRLDYLPLMQHLRLNTLMVEYRGYGASSGSPSEAGTYTDARTAWDYLVRTRGVPPDGIVLFGESLGGAVAAWLAVQEKPGALVLMSTFTSVPDLASELYPWLPARLIARIGYGTRERLAAVTAPVLVAHSPQDDIVPFAHGRRLFEAAREPKAFLELAGGHNDGFIFLRPEWGAQLGEFLDRHLPPQPRASAAGDNIAV